MKTHICRVGIWAPARRGLEEIDGLLVLPGKASNLLTDRLPAQEKWLSQTIHTYKPFLAELGGYIYEAHFEFIMLGKSPIKRPDMTIAVD